MISDPPQRIRRRRIRHRARLDVPTEGLGRCLLGRLRADNQLAASGEVLRRLRGRQHLRCVCGRRRRHEHRTRADGRRSHVRRLGRGVRRGRWC